MDITITNDGGFYTFNLNTEHSVNFVLNNLNIPTHMQISEDLFFMDDQDEVMNYLQKALSVGLTASLNGSKMVLNQENAIVYSS